jgi:CSLREA domain-containing protein
LEARALPATFTVSNTLDGPVAAAGDLPGSLRQAVFDANTLPGPDVIEFDASFASATTITLTAGFLAVSDAVALTGKGSALLTLNGGGATHFFEVGTTTGAVALTGVTLANGFNAAAGGAIRTTVAALSLTDVTITNCSAGPTAPAVFAFASGSVTAVNCAFTNNSVPAPSANVVGGAITFQGTQSLSLTDCLFDNNNLGAFTGTTASCSGGAVGGGGTGHLTMTRCKVTNNQAIQGGGVFLQNSNASTVVTITDCTFAGNFTPAKTGSGGGGALYFLGQFGSVNIQNSTFANNSAGGNSGGAVGVSGPATVTLRNCTLSGNSSANNGGAVRLYSQFTGKLSLLNSTVTLNSAKGTGAGISRGGGTLAIVGSVVAQNTAPTTGDVTSNYSVDYALIGATNGGTPTVVTPGKSVLGTLALPVNAKLLPLADNGGLTDTHLAGPGSPARNAGANPAPALALDQRGQPRVLEGQIDMGSTESADPTPSAKFDGLATVIAPGAAPNSVSVTYTASNAIAAGSIDVGDVTITGPGGPLAVTAAAVDVPADGSPRVGTYTFTPPGGAWDAGDNGAYTVTLNADQVFDTDLPTPNAVPAQVLGQFFVGVPTTFVVNATNDEAVDTDGKTSLREAILAANQVFANDVITFDSGVFAGATTIPMNAALGAIPVTDSLTVQAPGVPVTLDGQAATRLMVLDGPGDLSIAFDGLTFANGNNASGDGGAILNNGEHLTLANCRFVNNACKTTGSAIQNNFGNLTVSNTTFEGNTGAVGGLGYFGGAIWINFGSTASFTDCQFLDNKGGAGGAIAVAGNPSLTFTNCTATGNSSLSDGGFLYTRFDSAASLTFTNCVISGNTATGTIAGYGAGGGLFIGAPSSVTIAGSTISGNTAALRAGGGIYSLNQAVLTVTGSTISGNMAGQSGPAGGGGICLYNAGGLTLTGSTVSGNAAAGEGGGVYAFGKLAAFSVTNSTFSGNASSADGGAIALRSFNGPFLVRNSTLTLNKAAGTLGGGGLAVANANAAATFTLSSTVVAQNQGAAPDVAADTALTVAGDNNLVGVADVGQVSFSGTANIAGTLATPADAKLDPTLALNGAKAGTPLTHALLSGSPAIDAGNNAAGLALDQRGAVRVAGAAADVGAFEFAAAFPVPPTVTKVEVNAGVGVQRSNVTSLKVTFSEAVTFPDGIAGAFVLNRVGQPTGGPSAGAPLGAVNIQAVQSGAEVTITFLAGGVVPTEKGGSLIDGLYQLTIVAAKVAGLGGSLDGDGNGTGGDDFLTPAPVTGVVPGLIFRLFGDGDGDRDVDAANFGAFRAAFGTTNPTFDADGDGDVDAADFGSFRIRFGTQV